LGWNLKSLFGAAVGLPVTWIVDATSAFVAPPKASTPFGPALVEFTVMLVPDRAVIVAVEPEAKMPVEKLPPVKLIVPLL
jgi:hypothetical protein